MLLAGGEEGAGGEIVDNAPSPLPSPKRLRAGRRQGRGRIGSN